MGPGIGIEPALGAAISEALATGRPWLPESLGARLARELGLDTPFAAEVSDVEEASGLDLSEFPGERLVVKMISSEVAHKSDVGGVIVCSKNTMALEQAIDSIQRSLDGRASAEGFAVFEYIEHALSPGAELLIGARWTDDFGPVAVLGLGGVEVERLDRGGAGAPLLLSTAARDRSGHCLPADHDLIRLLTEPYRGQPARFDLQILDGIFSRILAFADTWMSAEREHRIVAFEFNPVVAGARGPTALDALIKPAAGPLDIAAPRPLAKLGNLFAPSSIAIAGVSRRMNIGRIILGNVLRQGFPRDKLWVVKPGSKEIDGCRSFPAFSALPEPVDLAVLAVAAEQLPELVEEIATGERAKSLILIPGGAGERPGSEGLARQLAAILRTARERTGGGPVVNGGNCLGVRSLPGRFDTLFIPGHKLSFEASRSTPLALLSQSGAFAIARASRLPALNPRYLVTFGNQVDLTLADYLTYLESDSEVSVFACYVEGFRPLDGRRFVEATRRISQSGRAVILYRAGRTIAGARAAASHTASVAGDYVVTRELVERAGGLVAESIEEFEDLIRTFCGLDGRKAGAGRLGAMSNAGFESVAIGDNLNGMELAQLAPATRARLEHLFREEHIDSIVAPSNPLDVTPVLGDEAFAEAASAILEDPNVDLGLIGCVPLTGALQTLPIGEGHSEDLDAEGAVSGKLIELWRSIDKPWAAVIDGGPTYDSLAQSLDRAGIPTFRSADRALAALARWRASSLRSGDRAGPRSR